MGLKELYYRLRGRRELYQIYTNITYSTPEQCLNHHGKIVSEKEKVPSLSECDFEMLDFPVGELGNYKEKKARMEELAERELERRELFRQGEKKLEDGNYDEAVTLFERSVKLDVFLSEVEECGSQHVSSLPPDISEKLKNLFVLGYKEKFGQKRYERLPEKMREDRKEAGLQKIRDLFG
ncbi:hypothetical protein KGY79_06850 [Candidatus Bipolaricaulota bacterium]|nr:hypothetical protein [Candidatus Bipolaricaulota bacterium]